MRSVVSGRDAERRDHVLFANTWARKLHEHTGRKQARAWDLERKRTSKSRRIGILSQNPEAKAGIGAFGVRSPPHGHAAGDKGKEMPASCPKWIYCKEMNKEHDYQHGDVAQHSARAATIMTQTAYQPEAASRPNWCRAGLDIPQPDPRSHSDRYRPGDVSADRCD